MIIPLFSAQVRLNLDIASSLQALSTAKTFISWTEFRRGLPRWPGAEAEALCRGAEGIELVQPAEEMASGGPNCSPQDLQDGY